MAEKQETPEEDDAKVYAKIFEKYTSQKFGFNTGPKPIQFYKERERSANHEDSDSWDEFERELDAEADRMLSQDCSLTPSQFIGFLNSAKRPKVIGAQSRYRISQCLLISLCVVLLATMIYTLLRDNGHYVRCPGSAECDECYGPFFRTSWCPNPGGNKRT